jgi:ABC-type sugar transport system ATPase subunit
MVPLVSIQNLSKSFPGARALDNARFELLSGEAGVRQPLNPTACLG